MVSVWKVNQHILLSGLGAPGSKSEGQMEFPLKWQSSHPDCIESH